MPHLRNATLLLFVLCLLVGQANCQSLGKILGLDVEFDESLFKSTLPSVMEVGHPYRVLTRIASNGTATGTFFVVLWCETEAISPQLVNQERMLRPGQAALANFTLVAVEATDDPQTVRAIVFGSLGEGVPPIKIWESNATIRRIETSPAAPHLLFLVVSAGIVLLLGGLCGRHLRSRKHRPGDERVRPVPA